MMSWLNSIAVYPPVTQPQPQVGPPQAGTGLPPPQAGLPFGLPQAAPPKEVCGLLFYLLLFVL